MRHTLACSFHKGAGHLPGCSVQPRAERGMVRPWGVSVTGGMGTTALTALGCPVPLHENGIPFLCDLDLDFFIPERDLKDSEFFCSDQFFTTCQVIPEHSFEILTFREYRTHSFPSLPAPGEMAQHTYQSCAFTTGYGGRTWSLGG